MERGYARPMLVGVAPPEIAALDAAIQRARTNGPYEFSVAFGVAAQLGAGDTIEIAGPAGADGPRIWGTISEIAGRQIAFELWSYQSPELVRGLRCEPRSA